MELVQMGEEEKTKAGSTMPAVPKLKIPGSEAGAASSGFNSDPVLLTYRAAEVLGFGATGMGGGGGGGDSDDSAFGEDDTREERKIKALADELETVKNRGNRKFVDRLRGEKGQESREERKRGKTVLMS